MIIKLLLKVWPSIIPITLYAIWILISKFLILRKSAKYINAKFYTVNKGDEATKSNGYFLLSNPSFTVVLYATFILTVLSFLFFALNEPKIDNGKYIPAKLEGNKVVPAKND